MADRQRCGYLDCGEYATGEIHIETEAGVLPLPLCTDHRHKLTHPDGSWHKFDEGEQ